MRAGLQASVLLYSECKQKSKYNAEKIPNQRIEKDAIKQTGDDQCSKYRLHSLADSLIH